MRKRPQSRFRNPPIPFEKQRKQAMQDQGKPGIEMLPELTDECDVRISRGRHMSERLATLRANQVHAAIIYPDGTVNNLGVSENLRTTVGLDWESAQLGGPVSVTLGAATSTSATSYTKTAAGWTVDAFKGYRVVANLTGLTTEPVYGNIGTNSATVLTVDQWWTAVDGTGGTPAGTNNGILITGGPARFVAVTTDASAASAASTTLTTEQNANGVSRALATYAHTGAASTYTQSKTWTASGTITAIHRAGMFTSSTLASVGIIVFETVLNADATLANGDQLAITWTVNI